MTKKKTPLEKLDKANSLLYQAWQILKEINVKTKHDWIGWACSDIAEASGSLSSARNYIKRLIDKDGVRQ